MKYNTILIIILLLAIFSTVFVVSQSAEERFYDLDGERVSLKDYKGKYSILAFTFMSCPSICPMTNTELSRLKEKYGDKINLITINVDPLNDTPEKLRKYMSTNNYSWDAIVTDMNEVKRVIGDILFYSDPEKYIESPAFHPPGLHLMDKDFKYTNKNFFPIAQDVDELMIELDKLIDK